MQYCCATCQRWIELDDLNATGPSAGCCPHCGTPMRAASGLLTQIASERIMHQKYDLAGTHAWPPEAHVYLEELHREAFKPKPTARSFLARWLGPSLCLAFLLSLGTLAQLYLGRPSAYAANPNQPFESQTIIAPALIPENPANPRNAAPSQSSSMAEARGPSLPRSGMGSE